MPAHIRQAARLDGARFLVRIWEACSLLGSPHLVPVPAFPFLARAPEHPPPMREPPCQNVPASTPLHRVRCRLPRYALFGCSSCSCAKATMPTGCQPHISPTNSKRPKSPAPSIGLPVASTHHGGYWLKTSPLSDAEMGLVLHAVRTHPRLTRLERCALEKRLLALGTPTQRSRWQLHTPASTHSKRHMESSIIPFERTDPLSLIRRALPQHSHVIYQLASDASLSKSACQTFAAHVLRHSGQSWFVGGVDTSTGLVHRMVRLDRIACLVTHDAGGVVLIAEGALNGEV